MNEHRPSWVQPRTFTAAAFPASTLLVAKGSARISVVIPARNEAVTLPRIVQEIRTALIEATPLVDELLVIDSDSTDATAAAAREAGAAVYPAGAIRPDLGWVPGKGEAMWKSLFVASGDLIVFVDGDLAHFSASYVTGLLGPLLMNADIDLVKAFYDRDLDGPGPNGTGARQGGRVTELLARPVINVWWPELAGVIQPLAGEWAVRRSLIESLPIPCGYGVELAVLVDTSCQRGVQSIAQVDLGRRTHSHQDLASLGVMAAEVLAAATQRHDRGLGTLAPGERMGTTMHQPGSGRGVDVDAWDVRPLNVAERPPQRSVPAVSTSHTNGDHTP